MPDPIRIQDYQNDFSAGVNSNVVTTIVSESNPRGLKRNQVAWLNNATVRGGGITPRKGWTYLTTLGDGTKRWQFGHIYEPDFSDPYIIYQIGGRIYQCRVDTDNSVVDLSAASGLTNPATTDRAFFAQGEQFLIIQAGDYGTSQVPTLPLFWDGTILRRSDGAQRNLAVTSGAFVGNTLGLNNVVNLTSPFLGYTNETVLLNDSLGNSYGFMQVVPANFYTIQSNIGGIVGQLIPAGTPVYHPDGSLVGNLLASFNSPALGTPINVKIDTAYSGQPLPAPVLILGQTWQINSTGTIPPGPNQVYLVTLDANAVGKTFPSGSGVYSIQELPAATCMVYYADRLWYAQNRVYTAGDIVSGPFGSVKYNFKDSILKVTENPLAVGGDGFSVPTSSGNIRALSYTANLDTSLGQGPLFVFTRGQIYQLIVPVTRADWITAGTNNMPQQTVAQIANGTASDTCVVPVNGDLFYQSLDPAIRSLISSIRYYGQWGNVSISSNEDRVISQNDRSLLHFASGIEFDNRMLQTALPTATSSGTVHKALVPLDFDIISTLEERLPPSWEGVYEIVPAYQLMSGNFGGRPRSFAVVQSNSGQIQLWEITDFEKSDTNTAGEARVTWVVETPAYTFGDENQFKELDNAEFWFDKIYGTCLFKLQYRQDGSSCWIDWWQWIICTARNSVEAGLQSYPIIEYCDNDQRPVVMPKAPGYGCSPTNQRPTNLGYQFQLRLTVKGFCRLRSIRIFALPRERQHYRDMACTYTRNQTNIITQGDVLGNPSTGDTFGNPNTGDQLGVPI